MATLNALKRAPILDQDGAHINGDFGVTSTDQAVARVGLASPEQLVRHRRRRRKRHDHGHAARRWRCRHAGGRTVVAAAPFAISLGEEVPA